MNPHNNWRRICGVAVVATLALFAGACSSDDDSKSETTTTVKGDKTTETTAKPLSDEAYSAKVAEISTAIKGAGTDLCALSTVTTEGPPEPANPKQTEEAVGLYVELLNAVASIVCRSPVRAPCLRQRRLLCLAPRRMGIRRTRHVCKTCLSNGGSRKSWRAS